MFRTGELLVAAALLAGCAASPKSENPNSGAPDSGSPDGGAPDAGSPDGGGFHLEAIFSGPDGAAWPAPWRHLGGVATATLSSGFGRMTPVASSTPYSLGRMGIAEVQRDVEVSFQLKFEDEPSQGVGFYVRQNGGYLQQPGLHGAGYAVFISSSFGGLGLWREEDGREAQIAGASVPLSSTVTYAVRFRVAQDQPSSTRLQARLWVASQAEPSAWQVEALDSTASLQGATGGFAVDSWSNQSTGTIVPGTLVGNIRVDGF
jgi:hypothetical protein